MIDADVMVVGDFTYQWSLANQVASAIRGAWKYDEVHGFDGLIDRAVGAEYVIFVQGAGLTDAVGRRCRLPNDTRPAIKALRELRARTPVVGLHTDLYVGLDRGRADQLRRDPQWCVDYAFTSDGDPASARYFDELGIRHVYLPAAAPVQFCEYIAPRAPSDSGIAFFGSTNYHTEWPYRRALVTWLRNTYGSRFFKYGWPETPALGYDFCDAVVQHAIIVGDTLCPGFDKPNYWSDRVYLTLAAGGFLVHPYIAGMDDTFQDGVHLRYYEYGDLDQLTELIAYYTEHTAERDAIRAQGHRLVAEQHTVDHRVSWMHNWLRANDSRIRG